MCSAKPTVSDISKQTFDFLPASPFAHPMDVYAARQCVVLGADLMRERDDA